MINGGSKGIEIPTRLFCGSPGLGRHSHRGHDAFATLDRGQAAASSQMTGNDPCIAPSSRLAERVAIFRLAP